MPYPRGGRRGRRIVGGMILIGLVVSLVGLAPTASYAAGDDYPYAGLGKCPLVPLPPKPPQTQNGTGKPGGPHQPGGPGHPGHPAQPQGTQNTPSGPNAPGPPDAPPPPRVCAKLIWFYNGSYGDPWGFALRNCTSFVAWRLRETNGLAEFENHFGGVHWGNANHWDEAAADLGYLVDGVPALGAVAQTDDGRVGHVAWVSAVDEGTVTVEEYNHGVAGGYGVRTVPTSSFRYLHLADLAPAPYLGSTRAEVATTDAHSGLWSARTTPAGALVVTRPSGRTTHLPAPGGWSTHAAPSVVTDGQGRVWVAAVTARGRVLTAHTSPGSGAFTRPRVALGGSTTSSPVLALDADGRVRLLSVSAGGTMLERHTAGRRSDRWSHARRLGMPGSWSVHAAPATTTDGDGRVWVAAVTRHGNLLSQHTSRDGRRWSGFHALDHRTWSVTSTPALTDGPDGRVWLVSVGHRGDLVVRHTNADADRWQIPASVLGAWSPYSSPAIALDRGGRVWLAAVELDGDLGVRSQADGGRRWHPSRGLPRSPASQTRSPALAATLGGVLVGVTDGRGRPVWRRPLGPSGLPTVHGPRGGGFSVSRFL
jgi:surface antigen